MNGVPANRQAYTDLYGRGRGETVQINPAWANGAKSDWALAELMTWSRTLTVEELGSVNAYLLGTRGMYDPRVGSDAGVQRVLAAGGNVSAPLTFTIADVVPFTCQALACDDCAGVDFVFEYANGTIRMTRDEVGNPRGWHQRVEITCATKAALELHSAAPSAARVPAGSFMCECEPGHRNATCVEDIDECTSAPCEHGGVCSQTAPDSYACACPTGFTGPDCESGEPVRIGFDSSLVHEPHCAVNGTMVTLVNPTAVNYTIYDLFVESPAGLANPNGKVRSTDDFADPLHSLDPRSGFTAYLGHNFFSTAFGSDSGAWPVKDRDAVIYADAGDGTGTVSEPHSAWPLGPMHSVANGSAVGARDVVCNWNRRGVFGWQRLPTTYVTPGQEPYPVQGFLAEPGKVRVQATQPVILSAVPAEIPAGLALEFAGESDRLHVGSGASPNWDLGPFTIDARIKLPEFVPGGEMMAPMVHCVPAPPPPHPCAGGVSLLDGGSVTIEGPYGPNQACRWGLTCSVGSPWLTFTGNFSTEAAHDFLRVFDHDGTVLGQYDGTTAPVAVAGSSSTIAVHFDSDSSGSGGGFAAEFRCALPAADTSDAAADGVAGGSWEMEVEMEVEVEVEMLPYREPEAPERSTEPCVDGNPAPNASFSILSFEAHRPANCSISFFVTAAVEPKFITYSSGGRVFPDGEEVVYRLMACVCRTGCKRGPRVHAGDWHHVAFSFSDAVRHHFSIDGVASHKRDVSAVPIAQGTGGMLVIGGGHGRLVQLKLWDSFVADPAEVLGCSCGSFAGPAGPEGFVLAPQFTAAAGRRQLTSPGGAAGGHRRTQEGAGLSDARPACPDVNPPRVGHEIVSFATQPGYASTVRVVSMADQNVLSMNGRVLLTLDAGQVWSGTMQSGASFTSSSGMIYGVELLGDHVAPMIPVGMQGTEFSVPGNASEIRVYCMVEEAPCVHAARCIGETLPCTVNIGAVGSNRSYSLEIGSQSWAAVDVQSQSDRGPWVLSSGSAVLVGITGGSRRGVSQRFSVPVAPGIAPEPEPEPEPMCNGSTVTDLAGLTSPVNGSTLDEGDNYELSCGGAGTEAMFMLSLQPGGSIDIGMDDNTYDSRHETSWGGDCPGTNVVTCTDDPDTARHQWTNDQGSAQTVFFVIDAYSSGRGEFTLSWTAEPGSSPSPPVPVPMQVPSGDLQMPIASRDLSAMKAWTRRVSGFALPPPSPNGTIGGYLEWAHTDGYVGADAQLMGAAAWVGENPCVPPSRKLRVKEGYIGVSLDVSLSAPPDRLTVMVAQANSQVIVRPPVLLFTPYNWSLSTPVEITAVDDVVHELDSENSGVLSFVFVDAMTLEETAQVALEFQVIENDPFGLFVAPAVLLAVGETAATLLHPPLPSVGVSIGMERARQQNDRTLLADG